MSVNLGQLGPRQSADIGHRDGPLVDRHVGNQALHLCGGTATAAAEEQVTRRTGEVTEEGRRPICRD